jgi:ABC-2 type transport system ATP-binding protein
MTSKSTAQQKYAIRAKSVAARYDEGDVISGINFDVNRGETFGLMGLNGAGKTTFIKILLGLMEPSMGAVEIEGKTTIDPETKYKIAYLPEKFEPPSFLTGMEFVRFSLKLYKKDFNEQKVLQAADRLALDRAALYRRVHTYSKGMRQKIGLLGTLLTKCPLMILDEPMSGLDPRARARVKDEILSCRKRGITVFLSSHILADMDELCDKVGVIHDGKLKFVGTPKALKSKVGADYLERAFLTIIEGGSDNVAVRKTSTTKSTAKRSKESSS